MRYLARLNEDVRQSRLAEILNIEGPTLVRTLDQLVDCRLVEREADPSDRRANVVRLTPEGKRLHQLMRRTLQKVRNELFSGIPDDAVKTTSEVLDALDRNLQSITSEPLASISSH
ncbi:MarR family transcriptional regulator [Pigmentiphaga sp.]|nr:MarR family transcriptional regulator [Pigmentiphaga sp.]MBX6317015.1 winged helix DNA-binding protein [Pigmentiphaga sp.]